MLFLTLRAEREMPDREILDSWKEIATYLDRSLKTCQRWENDYGLPVHRLDGSSKARVFAYKDEIDRWKAELARGKKTARSSPNYYWIVAVVVIALILTAVIYITRSGNNSDAPVSLAVPQPFLAEPGIFEESPAWSPSGDLVAFSSNKAGTRDVWICDQDGANLQNLTADSEGEDLYPAWSPDGQRIAFFSTRDNPGLYIMPANGGNPQKITEISAGIVWVTITWSRDDRLIYTDRHPANGRLNSFSIDPSGRNKRCLTFDVAELSQAHNSEISPSGDFLTWTHSMNQNSPIFSLNIASGKVETVDIEAHKFHWHPDGDMIYYLTQQESFINLWSVEIDSKTGRQKGLPRPLTQSLRITSFDPSPQDEQVLITQAHRRMNLWLFPLNEFGLPKFDSGTRLTEGDFVDSCARWIPGTDEISFITNRRGKNELWKLNVNDSSNTMQRIASGPEHLEEQTVSPDGNWIVASFQGLYIMHPDGSDFHKLDTEIMGEHVGVMISDWSPDGRFIVYSSDQGLGIAEMDLIKGHVMSVKSLNIPRDRSTGMAWHAFFSPDSRNITYESSELGDFDIWVSSIDGRDVRPIVVRPGDDRQPVFCYKDRDGFRNFQSWKSVFFSKASALISVTESERDIWLLDLKRD
jgi:Tol biopolymer transport system component